MTFMQTEEGCDGWCYRTVFLRVKLFGRCFCWAGKWEINR